VKTPFCVSEPIGNLLIHSETDFCSALDQQSKARRIGLLAAGGMRLLLLLAVGWVISLKKELFTIGDLEFSGKELILLDGGVFLLYSAANQTHPTKFSQAQRISRSKTPPEEYEVSSLTVTFHVLLAEPIEAHL